MNSTVVTSTRKKGYVYNRNWSCLQQKIVMLQQKKVMFTTENEVGYFNCNLMVAKIIL